MLAIAVWTLAIGLFFSDAVSFRKAFFYFDITEINYSYRDFLAREMQAGRLSRWHPGLYCGLPLYSESQAGYWHPLKFLYAVLPTWKALNLDMVLSVWLTGVGAYGWLRRHVGAAGALTGAGVLALSGFTWAHFVHTSMLNSLASVPFVLWGLEVAWSRRGATSVVAAVGGGLAVAAQVFAGHLQDALLMIGLVALYATYRVVVEPTMRGRGAALVAPAMLIAVGIGFSAVQWMPSKELLDRSPRAGGLDWDKLTYGSWTPELLPTFLWREAYGSVARDTDWMDGYYPYHEMNCYLGAVAIALGVVGFAARRDRWVAFWVLLALAAFALMLGKLTFLYDHAHRIPVLGSSRIPVRFHLWLAVATAALAAVGVDRLARPGNVDTRPALRTLCALALISAPILMYVYHPVWTDPDRWSTPYHLARFRWLGRELAVSAARTLVIALVGWWTLRFALSQAAPRRVLIAWAMPILVIADLLSAHWEASPTIDPRFWTVPPESARKLRDDTSCERIFGIADRKSGEPGYASKPVDFFAIRDPLDWSLPPIWGLKTSRGETPIIPRRLLAYTDHARPGLGRFDLESVTHILSSRRMLAIGDPGEPAGSTYIHRNPTALPRVRLAANPVYAANEADAITLLDRLGGAIRTRVVVEDPDRPLASDASVDPRSSARIVREIPERVEVEADTPTPAYLILADTFDPGWSATLDNRPAHIRPAWVAFRAVFLPAGRHVVVFRYTPAGFLAGLATSSATLILCAVLILVARKRGLPPPSAEHDDSPWPHAWPAWVAAALLAMVLASAFTISRSGQIKSHARWDFTFHTFTWGAGIDAMNLPGVK